MKGDELIDVAIAKVVPVTSGDQAINANRTFVLAMINEAYHKVESSALWKFSEAEDVINYTQGQRTVTVPEDFGVPLLVLDEATESQLIYFDDRQSAHNQSDKGQPQAYSLWGGELRLWPLPRKDGKIRVRYYANWLDLEDSDESEPILPDTWQHLLHEYAAGKLAQRLPPTGDRFLPNSRAQPYLDSFREGLAMMLASDLVLKTFDKVPYHDYYTEVLHPDNY